MQLNTQSKAPAMEAVPDSKVKPDLKSISSFTGETLLILLFFFVGCGLYAGKEIRQLPINAAQAATLNPMLTDPLFDVQQKGSAENTLSKQESLKWTYLLQTIDDSTLSPLEKLKKYQSLSISTAMLSAAAEGPIRQRFWSAQAVEYSAQVLQIIAQSGEMLPADTIEEAHTRLLLAMSLNYFQEGEIRTEELTNQFHNIDLEYLVKNGFLDNKLIRALAQESIIQLPGIYADIEI